MELDAAIRARTSTRTFRRGAVPAETLEKILEAARWAPSSCNLQLAEFVVADDPATLERLAREASDKFRWSDTVLVATYDGRLSRTHEAAAVSLGVAVQNILLRAADLGVASCPMAGFTGDAAIRRILGIPGHYRLGLLIALGYPEEGATPRPSRELARLAVGRRAHRNAWSPAAALNISEDLAEWTAEDALRYRERLAPVYLYDGHYRLQTFAPEVFADALALVEPGLASGARVLDLWSYDGVAARKLRGLRPDIEITCADDLPYVRDVLARDLKVRAVPLADVAPESADLATCVHKIEFDPDATRTLAAAAAALRPGGRLLVTASTLPLAKRLARLAGRVYDRLRGRERNVYEAGHYYKIGPRREIGSGELARLATAAGLRVVASGERAVAVPKARASQRYRYVIAQKEPTA